MNQPDGRNISVEILNERRRLAVRLRLNGMKVREVADQAELSAPTVISAHKAYLSGGWEAVPVKPRGRRAGAGQLGQPENKQQGPMHVTAKAVMAGPAALSVDASIRHSHGAKKPMSLTHLQRLEAESIHIMREVVAETDNPVMLYSVGKDSAVMLHLAMKAFFPAKPPFSLVLAGVVKAPEFRPLAFWIPAVLGRAERENAFLGARFFFITARATEGGVEIVFVERLFESLCFPDVGVDLRTMREWIDVFFHALGIDMDDQIHADLFGHLVAKAVHFLKLPGGIDMKQRKRWLGRKERLHGEMQHDRAVLANGIEHHRVLGFRDNLAHDVNALRLKALQVG